MKIVQDIDLDDVTLKLSDSQKLQSTVIFGEEERVVHIVQTQALKFTQPQNADVINICTASV